MKKSFYIVVGLASISLLFDCYFGIFHLVGYIIQVILLASIIVGIVSIVGFGNEKSFFSRISHVSIIIMAIIGIVEGVFLIFVFYNNLVPGKLSDITVSDGNQKVVFLQMSHIATPNFFNEKKKIITEYANQGYMVLVEGVRGGSPENELQFSQFIGFQFTPTLYPAIARFIHLDAQDNGMLYTDVQSGSLISVDISIDELVQLIGTGSLAMVSGEEKPLMNIDSEIQKLESLSNREKHFIAFVVRSLMNALLKHVGTIESIYGLDNKLFDIIVGHRNRNIVQYIHDNPNTSILVVYGGLHFSGVFSELQRSNPNWHIINIKTFTPYNF